MSLEQTTGLVKQQKPTSDGFLGGRLVVAQPARGFRAGLDSVLLGAAVGSGARTLLDLGAGVGVAALVALVHSPVLSATLVEADTALAGLAAANLDANGFGGQTRTLVLDVTTPGRQRLAAGLERDRYDAVIANPPYFTVGHGTPAEGDRRTARQLGEGDLDRWVRTAATHAAPGGEVIFIHPAEALPALIAAFDRRFGALTVLPFAPRQGEPASRVLVRGIKGSRAPVRLLASRPVHGEGAAFSPEVAAILAGDGRLLW